MDNQSPRPVVFLHDAAVDEYVSTMLLALSPAIDLQAVVLVNADCIAQPAMDAASKLQQFLGQQNVPVALSRARGWNAFPWPYRGDCVNFGAIPSLAPYVSTVATPPPSGDALLIELLEKAVASGNKLTVLATGPLTPVTDAVANRHDLITGIEAVLWMGGAINVPGNLDPTTVNPAVANTHAEWNAFWDPYAVKAALDLASAGLLPPIQLFPLDITNTAKLTPDFLSSLQAQGQTSRNSQLAYEGYSLVKQEPFYEMWDVTATCWLFNPSLYTPSVPMSLQIETWGFNQGWLQSAGAEKINAQVFLSFADQAGFYAQVLKLLA